MDVEEQSARPAGRGSPSLQSAATCRWGEPTLFMPAPFWRLASEFPWSCTVDGGTRILERSSCGTCPRWYPR